MTTLARDPAAAVLLARMRAEGVRAAVAPLGAGERAAVAPPGGGVRAS
jgi:hypothetical protein